MRLGIGDKDSPRPRNRGTEEPVGGREPVGGNPVGGGNRGRAGKRGGGNRDRRQPRGGLIDTIAPTLWRNARVVRNTISQFSTDVWTRPFSGSIPDCVRGLAAECASGLHGRRLVFPWGKSG